MSTSTANNQSHAFRPADKKAKLQATDKSKDSADLERIFKLTSNPSVTPTMLAEKFGLPTDAVHVSEGIKNSPY